VPWPVAYIAVIEPPSPAIIDKIHNKHHGVTFDEVREAVILCEVEESRWHYDSDPKRGWRLLVTGLTYTDRVLNVVLYPADSPAHWLWPPDQEDGIWRLGTAMEQE
jgi:hypothetical protein